VALHLDSSERSLLRTSVKFRIALFAVVLPLAGVSLALAHPHHGGPVSAESSGLIAGLLHPLLGIDHILAMLAVGLLGVQLGGRARWLLPAGFLAAMIAGGGLAAAGISLPLVEMAIALSVVVLGAALAAGSSLLAKVWGSYPLVVATPVVALFALFHGHAHGTEMPAMAAIWLYAAGFVAGTTLLLAAGTLVGQGVHAWQLSPRLVRISGAAVAVAGLALVAMAL
jgi:urease accessory protein